MVDNTRNGSGASPDGGTAEFFDFLKLFRLPSDALDFVLGNTPIASNVASFAEIARNSRMSAAVREASTLLEGVDRLVTVGVNSGIFPQVMQDAAVLMLNASDLFLQSGQTALELDIKKLADARDKLIGAQFEQLVDKDTARRIANNPNFTGKEMLPVVRKMARRSFSPVDRKSKDDILRIKENRIREQIDLIDKLKFSGITLLQLIISRSTKMADGGMAGMRGHVASLSGGSGLDAFVPLPGGRRIPVSLNFGGGSGFGGGASGPAGAGGGGFVGLTDSIESLAARSAASLGRGLGGALSRLIAGTESAGESFKRFGLDVLGQFKNIALGALRTSLFGSGGGGGAGGSGGGIGGSLLSSLGNALFNSLTRAANGGVMTVGGPLALRRYAAGGVARRPRLALFGEGGRPEAFVPLPDGRAIPVSLSGGGAGGLNVEINVAVDEPATASGAGGAEAARALARTVADAVRAELEGLARAPRRA